jgi:hypothetical protein
MDKLKQGQKQLPSTLLASKSKLGGSSIVVAKRKSNIVKSPKKGGSYSNYLKLQKSELKGGNNQNNQNTSLTGGGSRKVVIRQRRSKGAGRIKPCKNQKQKQEIPEIPILQVVRKDKKPAPKANVRKDKRPEPDARRSTKKVGRARREEKKVDRRVARPSQKKEVRRGTNRDRRVARRGSRRDLRRGGGTKKDKPKKGRKVSVTSARTLGKKETDKMQQTIKNIQTKTTTEMVKELEKEGVKVSGKSKSILKDIYMYHKMCGITIKRE